MAQPTSTSHMISNVGDNLQYGVGAPVVLTFTKAIPEAARAAVQKRFWVQTTPAQEGAWNWFSATEVHYRPKDFWKTGTKISLRLLFRGVPLGNGMYGDDDLTVDASIVDKDLRISVDDKTKTLTVTQDGQVVKTMPASLGKPSTPSSSGNMVIMTRAASEAARERVRYVVGGDLSAFAPCRVVIEAIVERLAPKRESFAALERVVAPDAMLATNTSALSITSIAAACQRPERVVGLHFFNPAPMMPLVEVVRGHATPDALVDAACALVQRWGKTTVVASDTPGFIVNRIARPFYGEALRILDEGIADCATIDWTMRTLGGFRMGPFELMDRSATT